jgi:hypothetical protein
MQGSTTLSRPITPMTSDSALPIDPGAATANGVGGGLSPSLGHHGSLRDPTRKASQQSLRRKASQKSLTAKSTPLPPSPLGSVPPTAPIELVIPVLPAGNSSVQVGA